METLRTGESPTVVTGEPFTYPGVVEFEQLATWPEELRDLLNREYRSLCAHEQRSREISRRRRVNVLARTKPHRNDHKQAFKRVISQVGSILAAQRLLCFHCTRLTRQESEAIRGHGLEPLSLDLIERRIAQAVEQGYLPAEIANILREDHQVLESGRINRVAFANQRSVLRFREDVIRLFSSWGGEALYNSHEHRAETGPALMAIGNPTIVVAAIPVRVLQTWQFMPEAFIRRFLSNCAINIEDGDGLQTFSTSLIHPEWILDIVPLGDPRFERVTGWSAWDPIGFISPDDRDERQADQEREKCAAVERFLSELEKQPEVKNRSEVREARQALDGGDISGALFALRPFLVEERRESDSPVSRWAKSRIVSMRGSMKKDSRSRVEIDESAALDLRRRISEHFSDPLATEAALLIRNLVLERQRLERQRNLNRLRYQQAISEIRRLNHFTEWRPEVDDPNGADGDSDYSKQADSSIPCKPPPQSRLRPFADAPPWKE